MSGTLCPDCISGVRHEGTPTGKIKKIGGVDVYVATPTREYPKEKALLFLPGDVGFHVAQEWYFIDCATDGMGVPLDNSQVYIIDLFDGDPIPLAIFEDKASRASFDIEGWIQRHDELVTRPILDSVIAALKERGIREFAAIGYCFGGKYVVNLAQDNVIKVGAVSHPPCVTADKLLGDGKYTPGYKRVHWEGCTHGFAVRGDMADPKVKAGKEGSFKETAAWIRKYL
ncbi:dienelactone hydrolase [Ramaria rubella]|nr:dienelactone hydrolase [Ramaria rubella]